MARQQQQQQGDYNEARRLVQAVFESAKSGEVARVEAALAALAGSEETTPTEALVQLRDGNGRTLLHFAASSGQREVCEYILGTAGALLDCEDADGSNALALAAAAQEDELCGLLLDRGASVASSRAGAPGALHRAAASGRVALVKRLVRDHGADVNGAAGTGTPLHWANDNLLVLKALLELGADANAKNEDGMTPLVMASASGHVECARTLVAAGADVAAEFMGGAQALHIAMSRGDEAMVKLLIEAGADPHARDADGESPIDMAVQSHQRPLIDAVMNKVGQGAIDQAVARKQAADAEAAAQGAAEAGSDEPAAASEADAAASVAAKDRGNDAYRKGDLETAVVAYTEAIGLDARNVAAWNNRAQCNLDLERFDDALADAGAARKLAPTNIKTYYRAGSALLGLKRYEEAAAAFWEGVHHEPDNRSLVQQFQRAIDLGKEEYQRSMGK